MYFTGFFFFDQKLSVKFVACGKPLRSIRLYIDF